MSRLRSDIWVSAYLRRCSVEGAYAVLRRRGAEEAGAIFVKIDKLDGRALLYGPAAQSEVSEDSDRSFMALHHGEELDPAQAEERLRREIDFDPDLWIVEVEDKAGRCFLNLIANS